MSIRVVPRIRTELTIIEMLNYGAQAFTRITNNIPPTLTLATAAAQWSTECGIKKGTANFVDGSKIIYNIWNNNWGNITVKPNADVDKHLLTTEERISKNPDVWKTMTLYYKAYKNPTDGAYDYWKKIINNYPKSYAVFHTGNPKLVAQTLSDEHYYSDLVEKYEANLKFFIPRYTRLLMTGREV